MIKTTNSGTNWNIVASGFADCVYARLHDIKFIDSKTGFLCGGNFNISCILQKTNNGGIN